MSRAELSARLSPRRGPRDDAAVDQADPDPSATPEAVQQTIERLQALGLQSDERFAEGFVRSRASRAGSRRIAAELRQRGIEGETLDQAVAEASRTDLQRARTLWSKRFQPSRDPRERSRQMRFLATRGFPMNVIRQVVGAEPGDPDEEEAP